MPDREELGTSLVRDLIKAEGMTVPGRVNALSIGLGFLLNVVVGLLDIVQAVVRIWRPEYDVGFPLIPLFAIYAGLSVACVGILAILEVRTH